MRGPTAAEQTLSTAAADRSRAAQGLDWFNLFVANIQTGFGPFVAVYLISRSWTQTAIGVALSIGTVTAMASQIPAGALVDALRSKIGIATISVVAFTACALLFAVDPLPLFVYLAEILHGFSSCTLGPAIASLSLAIAGRYAMGIRLGRNARYAAIGNGVGAALMGACGQYVSERAVFFLTAALTLPAIAALMPMRGIDAEARGRPAGVTGGTREGVATGEGVAGETGPPRSERWRSLWRVLSDRRLLIFSACATLFTFANAPLIMLISGSLTKEVGNPSLLIAACIVVPQIIVALSSPAFGRLAERRGRRLVLMIGFLMLPLRGLLFSVHLPPAAVVAVQSLDGIAGGCFGFMLPLIASDVAADSGHFTLALGVISFAVGIGGSLSTPAAGWVSDHFGMRPAFLALAAIGLAAVLLVAFGMPETKAEPPDH